MDDIYKNLSKKQRIQMVYDLQLQNTNGRETHDEMFMKGIEACYEELCDGEFTDENSGLHKHGVIASLPFSEYHEFNKWIEEKGWYEAAPMEYDNFEDPNNCIRLSIEELYTEWKRQ